MVLNFFHNPQNNTKLSKTSIVSFLFPIAFLLLSDSIMSYIFPILVEKQFNSNLAVGIVMALSSIAGSISDFILPQFFKNITWKTQIIVAILLSFLFPLTTFLGANFGLGLLFVIATIIWGIYFECLLFAEINFITTEEKRLDYSKDWGIIYLIAQITMVVGPIVGGLLIDNFQGYIFYLVTILLSVSLISAIISRKSETRSRKEIVNSATESKIQSLIKDMKVWKIAASKIFYVMITGITTTFIFATFWTIGGLFGEELFQGTGLESLVLILNTIPMILGSLILSRLKILKGKKFLSQLSILFGGSLLILIPFFKGANIFILITIALSSFVLSFAGPLNDSVFSELLERSGHSKNRMIGLTRINSSIGFIIAPLIAGLLSDLMDYHSVFGIVGFGCAIVGLILLIITPKKIKLPQKALKVIE